MLDAPAAALLVEAKSGGTAAGDFLATIAALRRLLQAAGETRAVDALVTFGGRQRQSRSEGMVLPWREIATVPWTMPGGPG